jgi:uncharacterized protein (TIGR04222 family)
MDQIETLFREIRARVEAYPLDDARDAGPFSRRVQRECRWSAPKTERAIAEYRRFVILAVAAGHRVSPSPSVDLVWHLHLTDTHRYWDEFCPQALGRPLHHEPSRGGAAEQEELRALYQKTLDSYQRLFGEAPPEEFWPPPRSPYWIVPRAYPPVAATVGGALLLAGCARIYDSSVPGAIDGPTFLGYYAFGSAVSLGLMIWIVRHVSTPRRPAEVRLSQLTPYEIAYLAGGIQRVVATALLYLSRNRYISIDAKTPRVTCLIPLPSTAAPIDAAIVKAADHDSSSVGGTKHVAQAVEHLQHRLEDMALVPTAGIREDAWIAAVLVMAPSLCLGAVRLAFGAAHHRPVGYLIILILAELLAAIFMTAYALRLTRHGRALVLAAKSAMPNKMRGSEDTEAIVQGMAIFGSAYLAGGGFDDFTRYLKVTNTSGNSSGGSNCGCGGGGCGG